MLAVIVAGGCGLDPVPGVSDSDTDTDGDGTADDGVDDGIDPDDTGSDDGNDDSVDVDPSSVAPPKVARLTDTQFGFTVLDVLGVALTEDEVDALPTDIPTGRDYSTSVETQAFSSQYVLAYAEVARSVTARLDPAALVSEHGGCDDVQPQCRPAFVESLGRAMYRRPLTDSESARLITLAETIASRIETTEEDAVRGVVQAMMQSPQFLYRIERETAGQPDTVRRIDGYELISRLSYFLWQSAPDDALLEFARGPNDNGVFDEDELVTQIERMIADDKFARSRAIFWGDYTFAARSSFGTSDPELADELRSSLLATVERISGADGDAQPLSALFDGDELVMTPTVAELAGAEPAGDGLQVYAIDQTQERLGVVTHPAFLAAMGTTSFVGRGLFLTERLLCQRVAEPPEEVEQEIEDTAQATENMTPREASEFRFGLEPICLVCHTQFEPIAYGFERYDMLGRYTTTDEIGRDLFSDGVLPEFQGRPEIEFADAKQLLAELADIDATQACLVENMTEYGTGRRAYQAGDFLDIAAAEFADDGLTYEALVGAVASSEQLTLMRVVQP